MDLQGRTVLIQQNNLGQLDVSNLEVGEYIIQLETEKGETKTARFLKQ